MNREKDNRFPLAKVLPIRYNRDALPLKISHQLPQYLSTKGGEGGRRRRRKRRKKKKKKKKETDQVVESVCV